MSPHPNAPVFPKHPQAQTAVLLASFNSPDREHVARVLRITQTPRRLYTLARVLRAAQAADLRAADAFVARFKQAA
jgi:hypothetical protein